MDIQVNDVSKIYGTGENEVVALCHANMIVHSGDFISISWGRLAAVKARCFTS